jgi:hypothetical protein
MCETNVGSPAILQRHRNVPIPRYLLRYSFDQSWLLVFWAPCSQALPECLQADRLFWDDTPAIHVLTAGSVDMQAKVLALPGGACSVYLAGCAYIPPVERCLPGLIK